VIERSDHVKEFTYLIPRKYLRAEIPGKKPIAVRAWETSVKGLIMQRPIEGSRSGEVHLTHKASGAIILFGLKGRKTALAAARKLKRFPVDFTVYDPASIQRQFSKLTDRQVRDFRKIAGMKGEVEPEKWRKYALACARTFRTMVAGWTGRQRKAARLHKRSKGDAWKQAKNRRKRL